MPTNISKMLFPLAKDIATPNIIMNINVIRGRFQVRRYGLIVLKLAIAMIAKKSSQSQSLPSAGSSGYAHHAMPYWIIVTKRWYITMNIKNGFKNFTIRELYSKEMSLNIFVREIKTSWKMYDKRYKIHDVNIVCF